MANDEMEIAERQPWFTAFNNDAAATLTLNLEVKFYWFWQKG